MSSAADSLAAPPAARPLLDRKSSLSTRLVFLTLLAIGIGYSGYSLVSDISGLSTRAATILPYFLLGVALLIALGFEFVNGFHDTANAVATVIYTHSLPPHVAVGCSGRLYVLGPLIR
jgi:PiT family inorganic phosphate transporter